MNIHHHDETTKVIHGDCIETMNQMEPESVDAIVTDPPYGLGFMGKKWDGLPPSLEWAEACYRVLKPGGHIAAFGGTRTWHRLAVAIEDAGFEMRDSLAWLYGGGFPKSHDVGKAIDKLAGAERTRVPYSGGAAPGAGNFGGGGTRYVGTKVGGDAITPETEQWDGWGTALKPGHEPVVVARKPHAPQDAGGSSAFEPIVLARKPLAEKTVARNVLAHGAGAINIDASRIGSVSGRWPANVLLDHHAAAWVDEQSGVLKSGGGDKAPRESSWFTSNSDAVSDYRTPDSGGASRFFYTAKAPKRERPNVDGVQHPTVKPLTIMEWLIRLVTPPGGTVLDPFAGSGTTLEAARKLGFKSIGIEAEEAYLPLIDQRIQRSNTGPTED